MKNILVTGGAGFIGSNLVKHLLTKYPDYTIINFDSLTYAGNLSNLSEAITHKNYHFVKGDITNEIEVDAVFEKYSIDTVLHLAAESHVDRSISNPMEFIKTNIIGTVVLLNSARKHWQDKQFKGCLFYHISTDEVYGSLDDTGLFEETTPYNPRSPYAASKASSDHIVRAYHHTYGLPIVVSNCSNNYGPYQFPEKLIPLFIHNIKNSIPLPVYGQGNQTRDWLYVGDHCNAIDLLMHKGCIGDTYNIGGHNEWKNIDLIHHVCSIMDVKLNRIAGESAKLITYVKDRAGHDMRYAIDASKIKNELNWVPNYTFESAIELTIDWYLNNTAWIANIINKEYQNYYKQQYELR